ncbi:MAG: hypothetical protein HOV83_34590, partial [Catenulispora sp.]|nr:hypothetical protein [Catenulispora sp.]
MTENTPAARILLGGTVVHLLELDGVVGAVRDRLTAPAPPARPLAIASANVDHIHHFGSAGQGGVDFEAVDPGRPDWLVLLDGVPLVRRAAALTGRTWPLLAGSDLLPLLLGVAEST